MDYQEKIERENQARAARAEAFHTQLAAVATALGGFAYVPDPPLNHWQVSGHLYSSAEKATLRVSLDLSTNAPTERAVLCGVYPQSAGGKRYAPNDAARIGFLVTRPAGQIAADIRRRFMADFQAHHAQAVRWVQQWTDSENAEKAALETLKEGGFVFYNDSREGSERNRVTGKPYADCCLYSTTVDVKLHHLTPAQAVQVAAFLRQIA